MASYSDEDFDALVISVVYDVLRGSDSNFDAWVSRQNHKASVAAFRLARGMLARGAPLDPAAKTAVRRYQRLATRVYRRSMIHNS